MRRSFMYVEKKIITTDDIKVTFRTTTASESITLPTDGVNNYVVDWADGSALETVKTSTPPVHTYAVAGDYDVKIGGSLNKWRFNNASVIISKDNLIKVDKFDAYKVGITDLSAAFYSCDNLASVKDLDTSNVTNMKYMFYGCISIIALDLSSFDTSKVTSMDSMIRFCYSLATLDLSNFDTSKVTDMDYMFLECGSNLCITANNNFTTTHLPSVKYMFHSSNILHPTPAEQADLTDANGAVYTYTGC